MSKIIGVTKRNLSELDKMELETLDVWTKHEFSENEKKDISVVKNG